jgi:hypothetical protein
MDMTASALPAFVELPGNSVGRIPYRATGATMHGFVFPATRRFLQRMCDRCLTDPSEGVLRFHVAAPYVLLTALYVDRMASADPIDKSKGFVKEADIGFWIPVVGGVIDQPTSWRLYWLPTYMFVDSGSALSSGREVFGYPKSLGIFARKGGDSAAFSVETEHFVRFAPDSEGRTRPLFAVHESGAPPARQAVGMSDIAGALWNLIAPGIPLETGIIKFTADALLPFVGMPMVFLKQFRDHRYPGRACYRAITSVTVEATSVHGAEFLDPTFKLSIEPSASHPIAADLGLENGVEPVLAIAARMGFEVGFGETLASIEA